MNTIRTAFAAATVVAGLLTANAASAYERWIEVVNTGNATLTEVRIANLDYPYWGPDLLSGIVRPGNSAVVDPVNTQGYCRFDIQLTYADGLIAEIYDVNLCEALQVVTDGHQYSVRSI